MEFHMKEMWRFFAVSVVLWPVSSLAHNSYEDCIIDSMQQVASNIAAHEIKKACRAKFPTMERATVDANQAAIDRIASTAKMKPNLLSGGTSYFIEFSNQTESIISQVTIAVDTVNGPVNYRKDLWVNPMNNGVFSVDVKQDQLPAGKVNWRFQSVKFAAEAPAD